MTNRWELWRGPTILGLLILREIDQPSFICDFQPTQAFEEVKPLFDKELELLNADKMEEWETAYDAIDALRLRLCSLEENLVIEEFILHIEGRTAWFIYTESIVASCAEDRAAIQGSLDI